MNTKINNDTICNNNLLVQANLVTLKRKLKANKLKDNELYDLINNSLEILRKMKKQGQNLESRTRKYRESIEALGFVRIRNNYDIQTNR